MRRVLFLNDYPMGEARRLWEAGSYPAQHLWGMADIGRFGYEPVYFPDRTWAGPPQKLKFSVQQLQAWTLSGHVDLVYSACQFNVWLLARLRRLGLLRRPLATVVHHPLRSPLQNAAYVAGHDLLLFLNRSVEQSVRERFPRELRRAATLGWGPDLDFARHAAPSGPPVGVLAAGKMKRDMRTLIDAARGASWTAALYCARSNLEGAGEIPGNVSVQANESGHILSYRDLYDRAAAARVIAVPLEAVDGLAGLTSVLDALALGKPLVMTRNRWLDLDPEAEGFGFTVEPGDTAGWRRALDKLLTNDDLAQAMGERARALAQRLNATSFARDLAQAFDAVIDGTPHTPAGH